MTRLLIKVFNPKDTVGRCNAMISGDNYKTVDDPHLLLRSPLEPDDLLAGSDVRFPIWGASERAMQQVIMQVNNNANCSLACRRNARW
jgi:hypothetical protein